MTHRVALCATSPGPAKVRGSPPVGCRLWHSTSIAPAGADVLADGLARAARHRAGRPVRRREVVVVPARGVERWLTQRLSHRLGRRRARRRRRLRRRRLPLARGRWSPMLTRHATTTTRGPPTRWPGRCSRSSTPASTSRGAATLAAHLGHGDAGDEAELRRGRRYAVARRLAGLFASYAVQRPTLLADWSRGPRHRRRRAARSTPTCAGSPSCGAGCSTGVDAPPPDVRHARHAGPARAADPRRSTCPPRLSLFGHTRLPVTEVELLAALGEHRDVHLWLPQPSPTRCGTRSAAAGGAGPIRAATTTAASAVGHPLLASLGRDARELQRTLRRRRPDGDDRAGDRARHRPTPCSAGSRHDLRANAAPDRRRARRRWPSRRPRRSRCTPATAPPARSRCCARCWSGCSQDDPTLEPRDILVMCPDIETYAPLISGRLRARRRRRSTARPPGPPAAGPARRPGARQTNPLLAWPRALLDLAGGRVTASEVLDLAARRAGAPPVRVQRRRPRAARPPGSRESGVRWGLDAEHRGDVRRWTASRRTPGASGLDRLLLGVAMSDDDHRLARPRRCRSTTSAATRSTWPAGSPSSSTGCAACTDRLGRRPTARPTGSTRSRDGVDALTDGRPRRRLAVRRSSQRELAADRRRRPAPRRARRCGWPTSARCSAPARAAARPGPTSAPAPSPSARWCRCARCRTGWSACSASTTASSRAPPRSTATTCSPATR